MELDNIKQISIKSSKILILKGVTYGGYPFKLYSKLAISENDKTQVAIIIKKLVLTKDDSVALGAGLSPIKRFKEVTLYSSNVMSLKLTTLNYLYNYFSNLINEYSH